MRQAWLRLPLLLSSRAAEDNAAAACLMFLQFCFHNFEPV
jgi:hypothetical protein